MRIPTTHTETDHANKCHPPVDLAVGAARAARVSGRSVAALSPDRRKKLATCVAPTKTRFAYLIRHANGYQPRIRKPTAPTNATHPWIRL